MGSSLSTSKIKDVDDYESRLFSQSQQVSTNAQVQEVNENIEDLKGLQNKNDKFNEIYSITNRIMKENDFDAMNFVAKENFLDYKNEYGGTIISHSIKQSNFQLARFVIEFSGINDYKYDTPKDPDFIRSLLKNNRLDVNKALNEAAAFGYLEVVKLLLTIPQIDISTVLLYASANGRLDVVKHLLTVPGINVNTNDNQNNTALICASFNGHHDVVKLLLTAPGIDNVSETTCEI